MEYNKKIILKNGKELLLRNAVLSDAENVYMVFNKIHGETDFLLSYPEENSYTIEQEGQYLDRKTKSDNEIEIIAFVDDKLVGLAGIEAVGSKYKVKHRATFGISILKEYWGQGIGKALIDACILCAKEAGYVQLELDAVSNNERAIALYKKVGFKEFGRNPKGFNSKECGYQELVYMYLEL